jgi:succinate-acetate transporter protein
MFGGLAQFLAGMWAYRARDAIATAMHGMWGAFWLAYGILNALFVTKVLTEPVGAFPELGWWFIALAAITAVGALAALFENVALFGVLGTLTSGATLAAIAFIEGNSGVEKAAGWVFVASAGLAWYVASAMMLASAAGKVVLPLGKYKMEANRPGEKVTYPIEYEWAEPGVRKGQ